MESRQSKSAIRWTFLKPEISLAHVERNKDCWPQLQILPIERKMLIDNLQIMELSDQIDSANMNALMEDMSPTQMQ